MAYQLVPRVNFKTWILGTSPIWQAGTHLCGAVSEWNSGWIPCAWLVWGVCVHWFSCCPPVCQSVPGVQCALAFKNLQFLDWQYSAYLTHPPHCWVVIAGSSSGLSRVGCWNMLCSAGYRMPHAQTAGDSHCSPSLHPYLLPSTPQAKKSRASSAFSTAPYCPWTLL